MLDGKKGWDREKIESVLKGRNETGVLLPVPVPVHLTYFTARADGQGKVHYRRDIYGRDIRLRKGLEKGPLAAK